MRKFSTAAALVLVIIGSVLISAPARAQAIIKVGDTANIKFGILLQAWADWTQDPVTDVYAQNLFLRRARFLVAGQVAPDVTFFFQTDNPNLGRVVGGTKTTTGFIVQDAMLEWKIADAFMIDAGLILSPLSRNGQQSAASHLTIDYGTYSFLFSAPEQNVVGRDTGFMFKGYVVDKHLEYRIGAFQGQRDAGSHQSFRTTGRIQYNFLETEQALFYPGTYLGKKKILAVGLGFDNQKDYSAFSADVFFDHPVGPAGAITAQGEFIRYDGGTTFTTLPKENTYLFELGYYLPKAKLTPWLRFEAKNFSDSINEGKNEKRYQAGLSYFLAGHNYNIKAGYGRVDPKTGKASNVFTLQLQAFYF
jgi:hypothetical protein